MSLAPGARLGPYEISGAIGAGGMGEVYKARDMRLDRTVAIKILSPEIASAPDLRERFEREARTIASLSHPHICTLHDVGRQDGTDFLVMEYLEGETLEQRLGRAAGGKAPALQVGEALQIGIQIADALAAAHRAGIVHRDLKPGNIMLVDPGGRSSGGRRGGPSASADASADSPEPWRRRSGPPVAKLLDFGLAKASAPAVAGSLSMLPTTPPGLTQQGTILGTFQYMAPEQLEGQDADARSDIFAFGAVLYEMLTGRKAFEGKSHASLIGAILKDTPPPVSRVQPDVPASLDRIVGACLAKDPEDRWQSARDLLRELRWVADGAAETPVPRAASGIRRVTWGSSLAVPLALVLVAVAAGAALMWALGAAPPTPQGVRFQIPPPGTSAAEMFTLSADGRSLAFVAGTGGPNQLWVRTMDTLEARALSGTDDATYPFWSPDGASLGFFAQGKLKKIAVAGGPAQTLCDVADGRGGTWNRDGAIVFSAGPTSPLLRVSAAGGVPAPATTLVEGDANGGHRYPAFLPDGVHFLYNVGSAKIEISGLYLGSLDGSATTRLLPDVTNALYVPAAAPSGSGYLVFRRENTLMAQPFDLRALQLTGEMFPVAEQVPTSRTAAFGAFSVSENGTLVYRTGSNFSNRELVWMDRTGTRLRSVTKPGAMAFSPAISPDQRTAAVRINAGSTADIWLQDLERDVISRFTFRPGIHSNPIWSPDGSRVAFSLGTYSTDIYQKPASGSGQEELLVHAGGINAGPNDWSPDGQWIVYQQTGQTTATDLWLLPLEGDRKPIPYLQTPFNEQGAKFWPGPESAPRWMAYHSNESGQPQIYVQAIPASGAKYQISTAGGTQPTWRRDGKELFYISTDRKLMAVPIAVGTSVTPGTPQPLFAADITGYTPSADGQRFLANVPAGGQAAAVPPITVVLNWTAGLQK